MAVRGPLRPDGPKPAQKGAEAPLSALEQALLRSGLAKTPTEARALALKLINALKKAGFPEVPKGSVPGKLEGQLKDFQRSNGIAVTGRLDSATLELLKDKGVLKDAGVDSGGPATGPGPEGRVDAPPFVASPLESGRAKAWRELSLKASPLLAPGSGGEGPAGPKAHEVAHEQARARAELSREDAPRSLSGLLEGLSKLGFPGAGKGKERLESALKQLQASLQLPRSGKLDEATVRELVSRGLLPEGSERAAQSSSGREVTSGHGGAGGAGVSEGAPDGAYATAGHTDPRGEVEDAHNAPAGDDDHSDRRRGHATLDDGSDDDEGYYEVPALSAQIAQALEGIVRDDDAKGATTYSWDVTFYRPGIYGRRQPTEPLWHVVVERASPFDPVWSEAREALASRLGDLEPDSAPPSDDDFQRALRRARVRDG